MTQPEENQDQLAFDEIQLKTDIDVHKVEQPPVKRERPAKTREGGSKALVWLFLILFLLAAGAAGWFYKQNLDLQLAQRVLEAEAAETAANLEDATSHLLEARGRLENTEGNLQQASGTLQDVQKNIARLQAGLKKAQVESEKLRGEKTALEADLSAAKAALKKEKTEHERSNRDLVSVRGQMKKATDERDATRRDLEKLEMDSSTRILALETQITDNQANYLKQLKAVETERDGLRGDTSRAKRDLDRIRQQLKDESSASLQIIEERSNLKGENDDLKRRLAKAEGNLGQARDRITTLEQVTLGDLVPFSQDVTPARINYREPLPDGVKIPKKLGQIVVMALVTEVGAVEAAYPLSGQELDATLAAAITRSVYKWKFTPPQQGGVRVKTWQPLLVSAP